MRKSSPEKQANENTPRLAGMQGTRQRSVAHPRYTLQEAEKLAKLIFAEGPRNCDADNIARKAGYTAAKNGAFLGLKATASQFGLISSSGSILSVSDDWIQVFVHEDDVKLLRNARKAAVRKPDLYKQVLEDYANRQLPSPEKLAQQLHISQKYGILKDAATVAAQVFYESAAYAGILNEKGFIELSKEIEEASETDTPLSQDSGQDSYVDEISLGKSVGSASDTLYVPKAAVQPTVSLAGLHKFEIPLTNGGMAFIFAPARLPSGEKERLKKFIDLMLEDSRPEVENKHSRSGSPTAGVVLNEK